MKNTKSIIFGTILAAAAALAVFASDAGSESDPLVTKSYVDSKLGLQITDEQKKEITDGILEEILPMIQSSAQTSTEAQANDSSRYVPVFVENGKIILGGEGTELILRSGKGQAYIEGVDGLVNTTTGQNVKKGNITANNVMIVPRDDGRGIRVTEDAWFLVRGSYEIE